MNISGYATAEGTARYRARLAGLAADEHFRLEQNLSLSSIGIGSYLGDYDAATDAGYTEAMVRAVELGINVIDTAANYRFQRSERAIGTALQQLIADGGAYRRDELLLCTKGGYLPFDGAPPRTQEDVRRYVTETFIAPGIITADDIAAGSHCIAPKYLAHQVAQSRANISVETLDVYYLHNPEAQLGGVTREEFERRLSAAFEQLERERAGGNLRFYGAATWNGFRVPVEAREHLSLARMVEIAETAGGDNHGFRFIQLPFNFAMPEALLGETQELNGSKLSLLEAAQQLGVTVIASASLLQGEVIKRGLTADVTAPLGSLRTDAQTAVQFVRSTPGITTALVGMSRRAHVEENAELVSIAPAPVSEFRKLFTHG